MKIIAPLFILLALVLGGCSKSDSKSAAKSEKVEKAEPTKKEGAGHAAHDVVPGSHDDWCDEHQVPESQCTRCDPELEAAFKATGDWCEEHGVPESQCLKCNPDLKIERPAKK